MRQRKDAPVPEPSTWAMRWLSRVSTQRLNATFRLIAKRGETGFGRSQPAAGQLEELEASGDEPGDGGVGVTRKFVVWRAQSRSPRFVRSWWEQTSGGLAGWPLVTRPGNRNFQPFQILMRKPVIAETVSTLVPVPAKGPDPGNPGKLAFAPGVPGNPDARPFCTFA